MTRASARIALALLSLGSAAAAAAADCPSAWQTVRPPASRLALCWRLDGEALRVEMSHPGYVWLALGFGEGMAGADAIVGRPETGIVQDVFIAGLSAESIVADSQQNISDAAVIFDGVRTALRFTRPLNTGEAGDFVIAPDRPSPIIWAAGEAPGFRGHFARGALRVDWASTQDARANYVWNRAMIIHVALALLAWGLMMPPGVLIARYFKVLRGQDFPRELDNQFWWNWHRILQYGGMATAVAAIVPVWGAHRGGAVGWHAATGFAALGLAGLQVLSGVLRGSKGGPVDDHGRPNPPQKIRGDHYDMTPRRRVFEAFHKIGGHLTILLGFAVIALGLREVGAHWTAWAVYLAGLGAFVGWFISLQKSGRWTDTYVAIWGPDGRHPGNPRARAEGRAKNPVSHNPG